MKSEIVEFMPHRRSQFGPPPKHDWPAIFDGRVHLLPLHALPSTPRNFARQVRRAADLYGVRVAIRTRAAKGVYVERLDALPPAS